ncbi:Retrovirus-related Pol polyprotein from transposon TNT 1-94 [Vitis vinifera]|uniref:Retrovirus-related Pol polyprotein from transposon TNT 1-94 n=1 Tax=Vitis vinifera TaxID=29760 RepID=A0A438I8B1_VITVI|nr:Retrovirus-related Pol polyprotein from transposon TNT 1-94 [Vitis vinifera]
MGQGYEDHLVTQEADIPEAQQIQLDKFFMVLTLIGLRPDLEPIRDQILGSSSVPSLDDVFARLLRISSTQTLPSDSTSDSSVLVSQTTSRGGRSGTRDRGQHPHCTYCNKLGHTRDRCYQLHGRPPRTAHMAQSFDSPLPQPPISSASQASIASVAQPGNASACLTHTSSLRPWILDSGASDHLSSIGLALPLPSLPLTSVLYTPEWKTIGIGRESQGLYHLTSDSSPAVCISTDAPLLIHNRLGHPSLSKFQKMVPRFSTLSSLPCESYQLGKHTRVSFPKCLNNQAKSPFELVHTDVWGPCRTASTLGFQYFVTFIDDYSRSPFTSFMSHHGILHQSSCAHTPQQNGVAERKNPHLVEAARTILLHSNVPFRFWGDTVLTACYLINRMPSFVLHDQIPHSLLFPDQPLYFLPPRVFGCTCFVHILTPGHDKLSAKAMKCLFLGYSKLQKGYRCYSLKTHRYFISIDVTFFEDSPFFSTTSESLPVSEVLPIPIVSPPDAMPPRPLQVYHRRPRVVAPLPFAEAPADSLPLPSASPAPALPSPNDLPIAIRKAPMKLFPIQTGDRQWWMKWLLCTLVALRILLFYPLVNLPLAVIGSTQLRLVLMVRLLLSVCFSPWLLCVLGLFISWILSREAGRRQAKLEEEARRRKSPHAPEREIQSPAGKLRVDDLLVPVPSQKLEISSRRSSWCGRCRKKTSPEKFAGDECFLMTIRLTGKYWEMGKVTGMKHGHRFPGVDDMGNRKELGFLPWL